MGACANCKGRVRPELKSERSAAGRLRLERRIACTWSSGLGVREGHGNRSWNAYTYTVKCGNLLLCTDADHINVDCRSEAKNIELNSTHRVRFALTGYDGNPQHAIASCSPDVRPPKPRFSMSTASQQSGDGGSLTISAGHAVTLAATTTDYGYPAAQVGDHVWMVDQTQVGTGSSTIIVPSHGSHDVWVSLTNQTGQSEAWATVTVVASDEAGSCDDLVTDFVELCEENVPRPYGVGGGEYNGTEYCWVNDWYRWSSTQQRYVYWYTQPLYCWAE